MVCTVSDVTEASHIPFTGESLMSQPDFVTVVIQSRAGRARTIRNRWLQRSATAGLLLLALIAPSPVVAIDNAVAAAHSNAAAR